METEENKNSTDMENLKEIPKWTRQYAQNRTLTILVVLVMSMLIGMLAIIPLM